MISLNKYHFQTADDTDDAQNWQTIIDTRDYSQYNAVLYGIGCSGTCSVYIDQGNNRHQCMGRWRRTII